MSQCIKRCDVTDKLIHEDIETTYGLELDYRCIKKPNKLSVYKQTILVRF